MLQLQLTLRPLNEGPRPRSTADQGHVACGGVRPARAATVVGAAAAGGGPHQSALVPWIDQTVGAFPTPTDCATCAPFMNQIATLPLVSCQRMSLLPSPLKSPVSMTDQVVGAEPTTADWVTCAPFISQIAR